MRIGFDAKRLFNNFTGLGNYSRNLLLNLAEYHSANDYYLYTPAVRQNTETAAILANSGFKICFPPDGSIKSLWRSFGINKQLNRDKIEIYHGLSHEIPFGKSRAKKVVTIHDLIFKVYPETYKLVDRLIYDTKFKYACKKADVVVAISECTKQDIIRYYGIPEEKIKVIYQSCHPLFYTQQTAEQLESVRNRLQLPPEFLLYVGSVIERKNLLLIAKALKELKGKTDIPLVVVGSGGAYLNKVKHFLQQEGLVNRVIWLTKLSDNTDLQALYQLAKIFIYPSIYEGFGIPLVEAMLSGTPVITSNVSCLPETVGSAGVLVSPHHPQELATRILEFLMNEDLRVESSQKALAFAQNKYDRQGLVKEMIAVYSNLIKVES